jgi:hypothetical protein
LRLILLLMIAMASGSTGWAADATFAPLWLYQGAWHVTRADVAPGAKSEELVNQCALVGKYFACQQTINGQQGNLLVFVGTDKPGYFHTQNITPDGRATGRQDLQVTGDKWTFEYTWDQGGRTTYYRITYTFAGKSKIHFEQAESSDGKDYKVTGSGDQVKVGSGMRS